MNQKTVEVNLLDTFLNSVDSSISYLAQGNDEQLAIDKVGSIVDYFHDNVIENPFMYSLCSETVDFGDIAIRDFKRNGFRILYEVNDTDDMTVIDVLLFLNQKQSIQNQLIEHCILYK
jgi:hypothetical protein